MRTTDIVHALEPVDALERVGLTGFVEVIHERRGADGLIIIERQLRPNLITQVGDQYYGERASGIASPPAQVTGMRLGTGTTAAAKTGAGAAIVTHITGSNVAIAGGFPTSALSGSSRRIQWQSVWPAGTATNAAITEAVITNLTPIGAGAGAAADTISRVVFTAVNKGALDSLTITWSHDLLGA